MKQLFCRLPSGFQYSTANGSRVWASVREGHGFLDRVFQNNGIAVKKQDISSLRNGHTLIVRRSKSEILAISDENGLAVILTDHLYGPIGGGVINDNDFKLMPCVSEKTEAEAGLEQVDCIPINDDD